VLLPWFICCCLLLPAAPITTPAAHTLCVYNCVDVLQYVSRTGPACGQAYRMSRSAAASPGEEPPSSVLCLGRAGTHNPVCCAFVLRALTTNPFRCVGVVLDCRVAAKAAVSSADGTKLAAVTEEGVDVYATADGRKVCGTGCATSLGSFSAAAVAAEPACLRMPTHLAEQEQRLCVAAHHLTPPDCLPTPLPCLQLASLPVAGVILMDWSRTGAYITTAQRPGKGPDGQQAKNIKVRAESVTTPVPCCVWAWGWVDRQLLVAKQHKSRAGANYTRSDSKRMPTCMSTPLAAVPVVVPDRQLPVPAPVGVGRGLVCCCV
jgi:hypothetical protein